MIDSWCNPNIETLFWTPFWVSEAAPRNLVDLKSAFDSVNRAALWLTLKGKGFPPVLLKLIEDLYTVTSARVRLGQ